MNDRALVIIGAGKVGTATGFLLSKTGYGIEAAVAQSEQSLVRASHFLPEARLLYPDDIAGIREAAENARIILITTKDDQIEDVCNKLVNKKIVKPSHLVIHMSGVNGLDALKAAAAIGAGTAGIHPMQSLADIEIAIEKLPGSCFGVTATGSAHDTALLLVSDLGGIPVEIADENKALYHAAACVASNYLVTLLDIARHIYGVAGIPDEIAVNAMMPLVKGTLANVEMIGTVTALTGPIARGDTTTIARHIDSIKARMGPDVLELYKTLGRNTVDLAIRKDSINKDAATEIMRLLEDEICLIEADEANKSNER